MAGKPSQTGPIVVYGATGFTGKLTAHELARQEADFVLAARNGQKLRHLADSLGGNVPTKVVAVDDHAGLRRLLEDAASVINCAGPFTVVGEAVVAAAVDTGTHYSDTTGEQLFVKKVFDRFGTPATEAGVSVVPAMGFDIVPADMGSRIAAEGLEPLEELQVSYSIQGMSASHGTLLSVLEVSRSGGLLYRNGNWQAPPKVPPQRLVDFPAPVGQRRCLAFAASEVVTIPRHTEVRDISTWLAAETFAPFRALERVIPWVMPVGELALRTPLRDLMQKGISRLPEGPSEASRQTNVITILIDAKGTDRMRRTVIRGKDIYGLTAGICVHGALLQSGKDFDRSGVLAPSQAFDASSFLEYLADFGLSIETN